MKRIALTVILGWIATASIVAGVITEEQARNIARIFRQSGARRTVPLTLVHTGMTMPTGARSMGEPAFYVYNYGDDEGFVIVSGDDATLPILAFSDKGKFVVGEQMPTQVASWLNGYCDYIRQVRSGNRYVEPAPDLGVDITIAVNPLMSSQWDQAEPYNNLCPPYDNVENCATGCAATAIAQIMRYHAWPETGEGSAVHNGKVIDFSQSHYDWENMLDTYDYGTSYPETQTQAVAKLMYDVGVSAEMQYGYESGTQNVYIYRSLYTHFKYSRQMQYLIRNTMTTAEWKSRIRQELDAGRPVYYGGFADDMSMGHAFVCDGIDESNNYFHFNWGWSGHCNGYYFLNSLNPPVLGIGGGAGNFNADHVAIVGIQPIQEGEPDELEHAILMIRKGFYTKTKQTTLGKNIDAQVSNVWNWGPEAISTKITVGMYDDKGYFVGVVGKVIDISMGYLFGKSMSIPVTIPQGTAPGKYELRVVHGDGYSDWKDVLYYYDCYQHCIPLEVVADEVIIKTPTQSEVQLQANLQQQPPAALLPGKLYTYQVMFSNISGWSFDGRIGCRLLQLPDVTDEPQGSVPETDTLTILQTDDLVWIYSEDAKLLEVDIRLRTPSAYLLQAYYNDPLSSDEIVINEWPLTLDEPAEKLERQIVIEQLWNGGDHRALQQLCETYPNNVIGITVRDAELPDYVDSLNLPAGTTALLNRVHDAGVTSATDGENHLTEWLKTPAIASVDAKARYMSETSDSIEVVLTSRFAYPADDTDMRFAVVTLECDSINASDLEWIHIHRATGYYPTGAWNGLKGSVPSKIETGKSYSYIMTLKPQSTKQLILVGLLIDGETGEICNACSLNQDEIAPPTGEVTPAKVNIEREKAVMNTGLVVRLNADVLPRSASQELVWTSSNPDVAVFDGQGELKTLIAGTTTIRATSTVNPEVYAEMELTVQPADYTQSQHVEAGYLHFLVDFNSCPDKLILSGEINGTDVALLRILCGGDDVIGDLVTTPNCPLDSLDLSECRIVAGGKPYYGDYVTENDVIGHDMFKRCLFLVDIKLPQTLVKIGDNAFSQSGRGDMKTIEIPASVESIGYAPFYGCQGFESFSVAEGNKAFKAVDGVLYNYEETELIAYPPTRRDSVYEALETLNRILPYAFNEACYLKEFKGNLRLSSVGYGAFYHAWSLETVTLIGNRLNKVDEFAFAQCTGLKSVNCGKTTPADCATNAFDGVPEDCVLNLPDDYDEKYHTASGWSRFTNISTSVETVRVEENVQISMIGRTVLLQGGRLGMPIAVYNSSGILTVYSVVSEKETRIPLFSSGVYIICMPGFNTKVVVR